MKIIFMGTPDFSVPTLRTLIESEHEVVACYTQPDKPKGRGKKMQMTPIKEICIENNIPVYQPTRIRNKEEVEAFLAIDCDVAVVIAYGQILPKAILEGPRYGCINIHASLLPKYRGAAPYQWSVINGEQITGITTMQMDIGVDTGDMYLKTEVEIGPIETAGSLHDKLKVLGGELILETLKQAESNTLKPIKQNDEAATKAPMFDKDFGHIVWNKDAKTIEQLIRGLSPWPSAFGYMNDQMMKIWDACVYESDDSDEHNSDINRSPVGTIVKILPKEGFVVSCKNSFLLVREIQLQGKKRMDVPSFLRGYKLEPNSIFN